MGFKKILFIIVVFPVFINSCVSVFDSPVETEETFQAIMVPEESFLFWSMVMNDDIANQYKAENGVTYCTLFFGDTLRKYFGNFVLKKIFPNGIERPNVTYQNWKSNSNLIRLAPEQYTITDIQEMADKGYLILMSYYYEHGPGHLAFVGNKNLILFTIPQLPNLEGKQGTDLDKTWQPIMVQAGTYTGITSMVYATNGWLREDHFSSGIVRYYLVKKTLP